jgi:hypothetical protein
VCSKSSVFFRLSSKLCMFFSSPMHAICFSHLVCPDFINRTISSEELKTVKSFTVRLSPVY